MSPGSRTNTHQLCGVFFRARRLVRQLDSHPSRSIGVLRQKLEALVITSFSKGRKNHTTSVFENTVAVHLHSRDSFETFDSA